MTSGPSESPNQPKKDEEKGRFSETLDNLKHNEKIEGLVSYAKSNTQDTIAYFLLIVGIIWAFFNNFYGGALVGLVVGYYFAKEILSVARQGQDFIEEHGMVRSLVVAGGLFTLFIAQPGFFFGAAIAVAAKHFLITETKD